MNLLITGGTGKLGRQILAELANRPDVRIRALTRNATSAFPEIETAFGDLTQPATLQAATENIDTVLHLAALTHSRQEERYFKINTEGTHNLLEACQAGGVRRFIHMSSRAANPEGGAYSKSKWLADEAVRNSPLDWTLLKPAEVYGAGTDEGIGQLIEWIDRWPVVPVIGDGEYTMSPVHVRDIVSGTINALSHSGLRGKSLVLGGPEEMSFNDLVDRLCAFRKKHRYKIHLPVVLMQGIVISMVALGIGNIVPDQIPRLLCSKDADTGEARSLLQYDPRPLEAGLQNIQSSLSGFLP